jgi:signal transduction histidine kinase
MRTSQRRAELAVWGALAFAAGFIPGWIDLRAVNVQGPALVLMIVNFALTLPGGAPVLLVSFASWLAMPVAQAIALHEVNPGMIIAIVPALIAAGGGRLFGSLLDTAAAELADAPAAADEPWYTRPLSTRFLLAVSLTIIAMLGVPVLSGLVRMMNFRTPADWQVTVWMIMTLLGWIAIAPIILRQRPLHNRARVDDVPGIRPLEFVMHVIVVATLAVLHTALVIVASAALAIPVLDHWHELAPILFKVFAPLDLLAYLSILALGFASDVERQRRSAAQQLVETRLSALRARLNPHFLFNALNSVAVLARSGKANESADVVDGVTSLLRYVLDERRQTVPLREELDFARSYLAVQRVRFGERLGASVTSSAEADTVLVPQLLLQPIVENAVEHGVAKTIDGGVVSIDASTTGDTLRLSVADDGPGPPDSLDREGVGLAGTRERLNHLYGPAATLTLARVSDAGGTRVDIVLPLRR